MPAATTGSSGRARERLENQAATRAKQLAQRRHMQAFVDRFRAKASKARQAQSRIKALARMEPIAAISEAHTVAFEFPSPELLAPPLITLDDIDVGYEPGRPVLRGLDLRLDMDDRIALLGANGNGKSTLVKLLAQRLAPMSGDDAPLRQAQGRLLRPAPSRGARPRRHAAAADGADDAALQRAEAARPPRPLRLRRGAVATRVGDLSGGEKARLLFALMSREAPHILLLDEPTNHLDVDARAGAGAGDQRLHRRRRADQPRPASDRAHRRPPLAGRRRHLPAI
jgi:ATP-binding cassette subfamily F protein 3